MDPSARSEPPPLPAGEPQPQQPQDEGWSWRKTVWVVVAVAVVAPLAWLPTMLVAAFFYGVFSFTLISKATFVMVLTIPFACAIAVEAARRGLKRGWHQQTMLLGCLSITAVGVVTLSAPTYNAFVRVRNAPQEKAVISRIRQLAAAADQYFLENHTTSVALSQLVGPTSYIKALNTVAGETYPMHFTQGVTITVTGVAGARTVTYAP